MNELETSIHGDLARRLVATPFQPFTIMMTEGKRYEIARKFQAALGRTIIAILPPTSDGTESVRIDSITALTPQ